MTAKAARTFAAIHPWRHRQMNSASGAVAAGFIKKRINAGLRSSNRRKELATIEGYESMHAIQKPSCRPERAGLAVCGRWSR
jgi:hypothetical protein